MNKVFVYTHTHWDREWYQPFETFRTYLVAVLKRILDEMEAGRLTRFYLDGQSIILDDALEIAPELAPRVVALMEKGELAAGPWYVLSDENLVCGESLIRNLKQGISSVRRFGNPSMVGYCPDTFAHSQDLPRILTGFGINNAFVWRGVPPLNYGPAFWWQSPDNSQVLTYHLKKGYYQTSLHEGDIVRDGNGGGLETVVEEIGKFAEDREDWDNSTLYEKTPNQILYPVGGDHVAPPRDFVTLLGQLNKKLAKKNIELVPIHLYEFAEMLEKQAKTPHTLVGMIRKELRDNCASAQNGNAYLLQGVLSTRLYLKRANREAERRLLRFAEPLFSILALRGLVDYPGAELAHAMRLLLKNHPHDSICGCSVDAVHDEMDIRNGRINQVLNALLEHSELQLSGMSERSSKAPRDPESDLKHIRIINPSGRPFTGPVRFQWQEKIGSKSEHDPALIQIEQEKIGQTLYAGWGRVPYYIEANCADGWLWVEDVPPYGEVNLPWPLKCSGESESTLKSGDDCPTEILEGVEGAEEGSSEGYSSENGASEKKSSGKFVPEKSAPRTSGGNPLAKASGKTLSNGILKVVVDERGMLSISWTHAENKSSDYKVNLSFRDTADGGDSYNYDPLPHDKPISSKFLSAHVGRKGPLLASIVLKHEIKIPELLLDDKPSGQGDMMLFKRSTQIKVHEIETEIVLRRGSRILEFETKFDNQASGHRLEALLSTGLPIHTTFSENHFSLAKRFHQTKNEQKINLPVDVGCESPCDRYPSQRFVIVNGQVVLNRGLPEYGVDGENLSLTILRAVGMLSRGRMQSRGGGAGPHLPVPGANCIGANLVSFAWAPLNIVQKSRLLTDSISDQNIAEAYDLAEAYEQDIYCSLSALGDTSTGALFSCENQAIRFVATYISDDQESLYIRLLNSTNEVFTATIRLNCTFHGAQLCRLDEEADKELFLYGDYEKSENSLDEEREVCFMDINFGANELKTLRLKLKDVEPEKVARSAARSRRKKASKTSGARA